MIRRIGSHRNNAAVQRVVSTSGSRWSNFIRSTGARTPPTGNNAIMAVNRASVLTRRQILGIVAAGVAPKWPAYAVESTAALAELAANKGITFGCQIASDFFSPSYLQLYQGNVKIVTPENDLKAWRLRSAPASYNFSGADRILAFASTNKIAVHVR